jgi:hypothetical protein
MAEWGNRITQRSASQAEEGYEDPREQGQPK